jgi:hypothetical protein
MFTDIDIFMTLNFDRQSFDSGVLVVINPSLSLHPNDH